VVACWACKLVGGWWPGLLVVGGLAGGWWWCGGGDLPVLSVYCGVEKASTG
jgi:hypothetical protein